MPIPFLIPLVLLAAGGTAVAVSTKDKPETSNRFYTATAAMPDYSIVKIAAAAVVAYYVYKKVV
jgi:hypothetical protein